MCLLHGRFRDWQHKIVSFHMWNALPKKAPLAPSLFFGTRLSALNLNWGTICKSCLFSVDTWFYTFARLVLNWFLCKSLCVTLRQKWLTDKVIISAGLLSVGLALGTTQRVSPSATWRCQGLNPGLLQLSCGCNLTPFSFSPRLSTCLPAELNKGKLRNQLQMGDPVHTPQWPLGNQGMKTPVLSLASIFLWVDFLWVDFRGSWSFCLGVVVNSHGLTSLPWICILYVAPPFPHPFPEAANVPVSYKNTFSLAGSSLVCFF